MFDNAGIFKVPIRLGDNRFVHEFIGQVSATEDDDLTESGNVHSRDGGSLVAMDLSAEAHERIYAAHGKAASGYDGTAIPLAHKLFAVEQWVDGIKARVLERSETQAKVEIAHLGQTAILTMRMPTAHEEMEMTRVLKTRHIHAGQTRLKGRGTAWGKMARACLLKAEGYTDSALDKIPHLHLKAAMLEATRESLLGAGLELDDEDAGKN
jgi:hypothetical protein